MVENEASLKIVIYTGTWNILTKKLINFELIGRSGLQVLGFVQFYPFGEGNGGIT